MATNWPPAAAPPWPPAGFSRLEFATLADAQDFVQSEGWSSAAPTGRESSSFFKNASCDDGHAVVGRMLVSPDGTRYPFAVCNNAAHRQFLVLWPPFVWNAQS